MTLNIPQVDMVTGGWWVLEVCKAKDLVLWQREAMFIQDCVLGLDLLFSSFLSLVWYFHWKNVF